MSFQQIPLGKLVVSPMNVRKDLGDISDLKVSIAKEGVLQPILVRPSKEREGFYEVIVGRRRFESASQLGLETIPGVVRELDDERARVESLVENIQRQSLRPMEEAAEIRTCWQRLGSLRRVAEMLGISHTYVAEKLRLVGLNPLVEESIRIAAKPSRAERYSGAAVPAKHAAMIARAIRKSGSIALSSPNVQTDILKHVAPLRQVDARKVSRRLAEEADTLRPEEIQSFIENAVKEPMTKSRDTRLLVRVSKEDRAALEEAAKISGLASVEKAVQEAIKAWLTQTWFTRTSEKDVGIPVR